MIDLKELRRLQESWQAPPELLRGSPREVQLTGNGITLWLVVLVLGLGGPAAGVALVAKAEQNAARTLRLAREGSDTEARVTRLSRNRGDNNCRATFLFETGGREYSRTARVPCRVWGKLFQGATLPVRYVASDPRINHLPGFERARTLPNWAGPAIGASLGLAALLLVRVLRYRRRLLETGRPALAIVTRHSTRRSQYGESNKAHYEFATLSGARAQGRYSVGSRKQLPSIGNTLTVIYDRDDPSHNMRYPISLYKLKP